MREYPILCCDVSCYYSKKKILRDSDRSYTTQPVQICELAMYVLEQKTTKNNIIHFHLKIELLAREYIPYVSSILTI